MSLEFPNPLSALERARSWPAGHEVGVFLSVGDQMTLVGTARARDDVKTLFDFLGKEWGRACDVLDDDFFADVMS